MDRRKVAWVAGGALTVALVAFGLGYWTGYGTAPREILDSEVKSAGIFGQETRRILSATVTNLRSENKLVVYQYTGDTRVSVARTDLRGLLRTTQELTVPATVTYFLDMAKLEQGDVRFDEQSQTVFVKLPPLMISDPAFQPERSRQINNGVLTLNADIVHELTKVNYASARKAFVKQAQQVDIVKLAKAQARTNIVAYFKIPLQVAVSPNIKVVAEF